VMAGLAAGLCTRARPVPPRTAGRPAARPAGAGEHVAAASQGRAA
jgi:hypothetical protein